MEQKSFLSFHKQVRSSMSNDLLFKRERGAPSISMFSSIMIILNSVIGLKVFSLAGGLTSGFFYTVFALIIICFINFLAYLIYTKSWIYGHSYSCRTIFGDLVSRKYAFIADLLIIISSLTFSINSYPNLDRLFERIISRFFGDNYPSILLNKPFVTYVVYSIIPVYICFVREIHHLTIVSYIGCFSLIMGFILAVIEVLAFQEHFIQPIYSFNNPSVFIQFLYLSTELLNSFPMIEHIAQLIEHPTHRRMMITVSISYSLELIAVLVISISTNFIVRFDDFDSNLVFEFDIERKSVIAIHIFLFIFQMTSMISRMWLASRHLFQMLAGQLDVAEWSESSDIPNVFGGLIIITMNAMCFLQQRIAQRVVQYCHIASMILQYIIPPICFNKMFGNSNKLWFAVSIFLILFGCADIIALLVQNISEEIGWKIL